jgi:hypothetical protein
MLEGRAGEEETPLYQPVIPDFWRVTDALARIGRLLGQSDQPQPLRTRCR